MKPQNKTESGYYTELQWARRYLPNRSKRLWKKFCKKQINKARRKEYAQHKTCKLIRDMYDL